MRPSKPQSPLQIYVEPTLASIPAGQPFQFRVSSPESAQLRNVKLQWMFNGRRIPGATGPDLCFAETKPRAEGEYKVVAIAGGMMHASNSVKLNVLPADGQSLEMPSRLDIRMPGATPHEAGEFFFDPAGEVNREVAGADSAEPAATVLAFPRVSGAQRKREFLEKILQRLESTRLKKAS